jgi:hypothetical protein
MGRKALPKKDFVQPDVEELIGQFEAWHEDDEQIQSLNDSIKEAKKKMSEAIKAYATDIGISVGSMKGAYKYWKNLSDGGDSTESENQFTLLAMIDSYVEKEKEKESEDKVS